MQADPISSSSAPLWGSPGFDGAFSVGEGRDGLRLAPLESATEGHGPSRQPLDSPQVSVARSRGRRVSAKLDGVLTNARSLKAQLLDRGEAFQTGNGCGDRAGTFRT